MNILTINTVLFSFIMATSALADYLTKDSGQVINIPSGYNACAFDERWNPRGVDEAGNFPLKALGDAIAEKMTACALTDDFPTEAECNGLSLGGESDPRCNVYE